MPRQHGELSAFPRALHPAGRTSSHSLTLSYSLSLVHLLAPAVSADLASSTRQDPDEFGLASRLPALDMAAVEERMKQGRWLWAKQLRLQDLGMFR